MSGTISIDSDRKWSSSSGIFYWVVDTLASHVRDSGLSDELKEISEENLGWFDIGGLELSKRSEIVRVMREHLARLAEDEIDHSFENRQETIRHVVALIELLDEAYPTEK
jgi:hypothetical protein